MNESLMEWYNKELLKFRRAFIGPRFDPDYSRFTREEVELVMKQKRACRHYFEQFKEQIKAVITTRPTPYFEDWDISKDVDEFMENQAKKPRPKEDRRWGR